jgi:hypothetical protein
MNERNRSSAQFQSANFGGFPATPGAVCALSNYFTRSNVMDDNTLDVEGSAAPNTDGKQICGAMAEQAGVSGHHDTESAPQKFLHLVGYRDPNARKEPWVRPRPSARKS